METIDLSVLVAVYNAEKYLEQCLDSLIDQSVVRMEIIIVNDRSTDRSNQILKKYEKSFKYINIINKKKNEGTLLTRLDGMFQAVGRYVAFIDGDDTYQPQSLHNVLGVALEKKVDILEFEYRMIDTENKDVSNSSMGQNIVSDNTLIEGKKQCFDLLDRLEVPLFKRLYSKRLCRKVIDYFMHFIDYRDRFQGMLNEDEFLTPLFFSNARSYCCIGQKVYNYRFLRYGSITHKISTNCERKVRAGEEYMYICMNLSDEFERKGLINKKEYFKYNIKGIQFFLYKCVEGNVAIFHRMKMVNKYYSLWKIMYIYCGKWIFELMFPKGIRKGRRILPYERKIRNHWNCGHFISALFTGINDR